jgi:hypothetical protein
VTWTPITRSNPEPKGVNARYSGLLDVDVRLSSSPPSEWAEFFSRPFAVPTKLSMHPPRLSGSTVRLMLPDNEFDEYIQNLDARIAAANEYFERQVLPGLQSAQARETVRRDEERRRVEKARRRADGM